MLNNYGEPIEVMNDFTLNLNYWDCECPDNFIHPITNEICSICNSFREDQPNSRENEIEIVRNNSFPK